MTLDELYDSLTGPWVYNAGLVFQVGFLWYRATRMDKEDWRYAAVHLTTAAICLLCLISGTFTPETGMALRNWLQVATSVSFAAFVVYSERKLMFGSDHFRFNPYTTTVSIIGIIALVVFFSLREFSAEAVSSAERAKLNKIEHAATVAAKTSQQNQKINLKNESASRYRTGLVEDMMGMMVDFKEQVEQVYFVVQQTRNDQLREYRRRQQWEKMHDQRLQEVERAVEK